MGSASAWAAPRASATACRSRFSTLACRSDTGSAKHGQVASSSCSIRGSDRGTGGRRRKSGRRAARDGMVRRMETSPEARTAGAELAPAELPVEHADLPALGGHIGPEPEDFVVDELPLYAASGQGDHWYVRLRKRACTTADLKRAVAEAAGVPEREIGHAGLKDK